MRCDTDRQDADEDVEQSEHSETHASHHAQRLAVLCVERSVIRNLCCFRFGHRREG
jgi:hypothetical protein